MAGLKLQFTEAGLAKLLSEQGKGLKGEITHMAFGDGAYAPGKNQTALLSEKERIEVMDYQGDGKHLRMAGKFEGELEYAIREIGIFLSDGTLLGVYSQAGKTLGYRTPVVKILQWFTLNIEALPSDSVTVVVGSENLNLVIDEEFAQLAEVQINTLHRQMQQEFRLLALEQQAG
ncbi:phage tail protein [Thalassomonas haliotis]|uniref:Phage tail protein n=1 Tax=Thalassomonas haliotis TaxID=485448 RepID=A0ABY7VCZ3_9GAMM|nr:phage tail protein [Thalassomonas haliotis]WDE11156.1 phage tail protein [Thalassomonas haliotis]